MKEFTNVKFVSVIISLGILFLALNLFLLQDNSGISAKRLNILGFSPGLSSLAANSYRGLEIIDTTNGSTATLNDAGQRIAFSKNGKFLALFNRDKNYISVWDLSSNPPVKRKELSLAAGGGLAWSPDNHRLAMVDNAQLSIFNIVDDSVKSVPLPSHEHFYYRSLKFIPEKGNLLYLLNPAHFEGKKTFEKTSTPGNLEIRDPVTLALKETINLPVDTNDWSPALSPDGTFVKQEESTSSEQSEEGWPLKITLFDVITKSVSKVIEVPGHESSGFEHRFSDDSRLLAIPRADMVTVWSTETGRKLYQLISLGMREENGYSEYALLPDETGIMIARNSDICSYLFKDGGKPFTCTPINILPDASRYQWQVLVTVFIAIFAILVMLFFRMRKSAEVRLPTGMKFPLGIAAVTYIGGLLLFEGIEGIYGLCFPSIVEINPNTHISVYTSSWSDGLMQATMLLPFSICLIFRVLKSYSNMPDSQWKNWRNISVILLIVSGFIAFAVLGANA